MLIKNVEYRVDSALGRAFKQAITFDPTLISFGDRYGP